MATGPGRGRRRVAPPLGDWRKHYEELWMPENNGPSDGMTLPAFIAARNAIHAAAHAFDVPADCQHCKHFEMGDCKKHAAPIPAEFQTQAEACEDWTFDGI